MLNVLFVCLGNICRSPLAEAVFNHKVKQADLDGKITADSAGTGDYHIGCDPDERSINVALKYEIPISHKGRQFHYMDGKNFDYILAMDEANYRNIIHELGDKHQGLYLMRDFDPEGKGDVPDPYWSDGDGFEQVYRILDRSIDNFLKFIKKEHNL